MTFAPVAKMGHDDVVLSGGGPQATGTADDLDAVELVDLVRQGGHDFYVVAVPNQIYEAFVRREPRPNPGVRWVEGRDPQHLHGQLEVTGVLLVFVSFVKASTSLTRNPYSASARMATRLFSNSDTRLPLIVTGASVEIR